MSDALKPSSGPSHQTPMGPRLVQGPKPKPKKPRKKRTKSLVSKTGKVQIPKFRNAMEMYRFRMREEQKQEVIDRLVEFLAPFRSTDVGEPKKMPCRTESLSSFVEPEVVGIIQDILRAMRDGWGKDIREFDKTVGITLCGKPE